MMAALKDKNRDVRRSAATSLAKLRDPRAAEALSEALLDQWYRVGESAATALRKLKVRPHLEPLMNGVHDKDASVRARAASLLGEYGDHTAVEGLVEALDDKEGNVRSAAAQALGKLNDGAAVEPLVRALANRDTWKDPYLVAKIATALGNLRDRTGTGALLGLLQHERPEVRYAAILALREIGDARAIGPLQEVQYADRASTMVVSGKGAAGAVRLADAARDAITHIRTTAGKDL